MSIVTWAVFYAYLARLEKPSKTLHSAGRVLATPAYVHGLVLFLAYWVTQPIEQVHISFHSLYQHAFLPAIVFGDAIITPTTFR